MKGLIAWLLASLPGLATRGRRFEANIRSAWGEGGGEADRAAKVSRRVGLSGEQRPDGLENCPLAWYRPGDRCFYLLAGTARLLRLKVESGDLGWVDESDWPKLVADPTTDLSSATRLAAIVGSNCRPCSFPLRWCFGA